MMPLEQENYCFVCGKNNPRGLKLKINADNGKTEFVFRARKEYEGWKGIIHGGIVSTLLDEAMVWACTSAGYKTVTAEINVRFRKPLYVGTTVKVEGRIEDVKKRLIIAYGVVFDDKEIYAEGRGKFFIV